MEPMAAAFTVMAAWRISLFTPPCPTAYSALKVTASRRPFCWWAVKDWLSIDGAAGRRLEEGKVISQY
jgi:hypothetical protein